MDVVRPPCVLVIRPGIGAGTDGQHLVAAVGVGEDPSGAGEIRIERRVVLVRRVVVAAGGVGLPDFYHRMWHRPPVLVGDAPGDDDPLALRPPPVHCRHIRHRREQGGREGGAGGLGDGVRQLVQLMPRMALARAEVVRRVEAGLRAGGVGPERDRVAHWRCLLQFLFLAGNSHNGTASRNAILRYPVSASADPGNILERIVNAAREAVKQRGPKA